jgi:hypothetical protein
MLSPALYQKRDGLVYYLKTKAKATVMGGFLAANGIKTR